MSNDLIYHRRKTDKVKTKHALKTFSASSMHKLLYHSKEVHLRGRKVPSQIKHLTKPTIFFNDYHLTLRSLGRNETSMCKNLKYQCGGSFNQGSYILTGFGKNILILKLVNMIAWCKMKHCEVIYVYCGSSNMRVLTFFREILFFCFLVV